MYIFIVIDTNRYPANYFQNHFILRYHKHKNEEQIISNFITGVWHPFCRTARFAEGHKSIETCLTLFNSEVPKLSKQKMLFSGTWHISSGYRVLGWQIILFFHHLKEVILIVPCSRLLLMRSSDNLHHCFSLCNRLFSSSCFCYFFFIILIFEHSDYNLPKCSFLWVSLTWVLLKFSGH